MYILESILMHEQDNFSTYRANLNPFDIRLNKKDSFKNRLTKIRSIFGGSIKIKGNAWWKLPTKRRYGLFNYLIGAPIHLLASVASGVCAGVVGLGGLLGLAAIKTYEALEKLLESLGVLPILLYAIPLALGAAAIAAGAAGAVAYTIVKPIVYSVDLLIQRGLIPLLELVVSPISFLTAGAIHLGLGVKNYFRKNAEARCTNNLAPPCNPDTSAHVLEKLNLHPVEAPKPKASKPDGAISPLAVHSNFAGNGNGTSPVRLTKSKKRNHLKASDRQANQPVEVAQQPSLTKRA